MSTYTKLKRKKNLENVSQEPSDAFFYEYKNFKRYNKPFQSHSHVNKTLYVMLDSST